MTIDIGQCRFCHRDAVQWLDCDGKQDLGLCSRHCTFSFAAAELHAAWQDLKWALCEGILDGMTQAGIKWRALRRRWRYR